jgi:hypothetical protein
VDRLRTSAFGKILVPDHTEFENGEVKFEERHSNLLRKEKTASQQRRNNENAV